MPSEAASVASRMRTGALLGSAWKAALIRSRSSRSMPPYIVISRSPPVKPSAASSSCSQFCVARYSVKMMTRSSVHLPAGLSVRRSQSISSLGLGVELATRPAPPTRCISVEQRRSSCGRLAEEQAWRRPRRRSAASSYSSSSA